MYKVKEKPPVQGGFSSTTDAVLFGDYFRASFVDVKAT